MGEMSAHATPEQQKPEKLTHGPPNKPWLMPQRRKLRHLQGLSVRNLFVSAHEEPPDQEKAYDDDNAPNAFQTVDKQQSRLKVESLHPSKSAENLGASSRQESGQLPSFKGKERADGRQKGFAPRQRRDTLPSLGPDPATRQKTLEDIARVRLCDSMFSLHCAGNDEPVYISEVIEKKMNPDFRVFNLNHCGPAVSRQDQVTVKLWAKSGVMEDYVLLLEYHVELKSLQYLAKSLDCFRYPLPTNCLIFHFPEGVYASLTGIPTLPPSPKPLDKEEEARAQYTSSYDALMRLANLDVCIQDALITRDKIEAQMNAIIAKNQSSFDLMNTKASKEIFLEDVQKATAMEKENLDAAIKQRDELKQKMATSRDNMAKARQQQHETTGYIEETKTSTEANREAVKKINSQSAAQLRRVCEDLSNIYPIEAIPGKPLAFTICGVYLPNSAFEDINKEEVAAALGYAAQLLALISYYSDLPLPYLVDPYLSNSTIEDQISNGLVHRTFPLYPSNPFYRFEYGVFLLNKDIEYLITRLGIRVIDIRQTLPNLKYLLYILTSGTGDVPPRKAGSVIRGLLGPGRAATFDTASRRDSLDSTASSGNASLAGNDSVSKRMRDQLRQRNEFAGSPSRESASLMPELDARRRATGAASSQTNSPRVALSDEQAQARHLT